MNEYREWGKWVRDNPDCLKTKSTWLMVERSKLPANRRVYVMTDDRGLQIDRGSVNWRDIAQCQPMCS